MISSSDALAVTLSVIDSLVETDYNNTDRLLFRKVAERTLSTSLWNTTIQLSQAESTRPITFYLSLQCLQDNSLGQGSYRSYFEIAAIFHDNEAKYGYWDSCWYKNGKPLAAELAEQLHPLAQLASSTVDATFCRVESLSSLCAFIRANSVRVKPTPEDSP